MSILGNINRLIEDEPQGGFKVPAVAKPEKEDFSLKKCLVISSALHPAVVGMVALLIFVLTLLGINLFMLDRPKPKTQDIEFVLVDKEATPINKNTKYRSDKNSRAGGKHNPKKKVSMPSVATKKTPTATPSRASKPSKAVQKPRAQAKAKSNSWTQAFAPTPQKQAAPSKPAPPSARPSLAPPSAPKINTSAKAPIGLPAPPNLQTGKSYSTGPVGGGSGGKSRTLASSGGSSSGSGVRSGASTGSRGGSGSAGNPGPGNPNGAFGIDALREPNFGPYMRDLQSRIKNNWDPPKGNESKRVVLMFRIAKNGQLLSNKVSKSSGLSSADRAALNAVEVTAPFKPLPAEFKGQYIDIQFTFDYNVFGATGY